MIVANKFQTGFDQPKLVAMYLDKKISRVEAVQTPARETLMIFNESLTKFVRCNRKMGGHSPPPIHPM